MQERIICKACGYVMEQRTLKDKCPACGVPSKMFVPYTERISPPRNRVLQLDLHPILVHFTQAFSLTLPALCLIAWAFLPAQPNPVTGAIGVLSVALPFVVLLTFLAGMLDGKIRFRRLTTPLLQTKLVWGALLFVLSCALLAAALLHPSLPLMLALSAPAAICSSYLGLLGVRMINAAFPG